MMEADIIKYHIYFLSGGRLHAFDKKMEKSFRVTPVRRIHYQFAIVRVDCAKNGCSFALALGLAHFGLLPFFRPRVRNRSRIRQRGLVFKQHYAADSSFPKFFLLQLQYPPCLRLREKSLSPFENSNQANVKYCIYEPSCSRRKKQYGYIPLPAPMSMWNS